MSAGGKQEVPIVATSRQGKESNGKEKLTTQTKQVGGQPQNVQDNSSTPTTVATTTSDKVSTNNDTVSGQQGAKPKKSRACFKCGHLGHWANKCRVPVSEQKQHSSQQKSYQQHVKKADVVSDETDSEQLAWNLFH